MNSKHLNMLYQERDATIWLFMVLCYKILDCTHMYPLLDPDDAVYLDIKYRLDLAKSNSSRLF